MLIDNESEPLGELEIEETKSDLPEKYRAKSLEEVVRMHQEAEKLIGKQAQEVGEVRKLADELLKQNLSSKQQRIQEEEPEVDFFENPQKAVQTSREAARGIPLILEAVLLVFMGLVFHPPVLLVLELAAQGMVFFLVAH